MGEDYEKNKLGGSDDLFAEFDRISDNFNRTAVSGRGSSYRGSSSSDSAGGEGEAASSTERKTRMQKLSEKQSKSRLSALRAGVKAAANRSSDYFSEHFMTKNEGDSGAREGGKKKTRKKKKKYRLNKWKLVRLFAVLFLLVAVICGAYVAKVVSNAPKIDPDNIYSLLSENSVLYDDSGNVIDNVFQSGEGLRTNVSYAEMPENLVNAFVAIEDKTFWKHSGFNFIRMIGAIKDSLFSRNRVGGTSTITQQLARNLFLADIKSQRSLSRKITEAYYAIQLEKNLTKEQIIEAYLNTIYLGYNAYGVQAASLAYFSKDVSELDLLECAALASLPKSPDKSALIRRLYSESVEEENENIISRGGEFTYVYNGDASESRRNQTLKNMLEQEDKNGEPMISSAAYEAALADDLRAHINPSSDSSNEISSYFADYVINQVINELMESRNLEYADARRIIYTGGLQIYTTMNSEMQKTVEREFADGSNFPGVRSLKTDASGNLVSESGKILLYSSANFFDSEGNFVLYPDEYEWLSDGSLKLLHGKRLNFYTTSVNGETDYSVEFKGLYQIVDDVFYSCEGGYIGIAQKYKSKNADGDLLISAEFFENNPNFFTLGEDGISLDSEKYTMKQMVIQPQSAMVIMDYHSGQVKAMVGGRDTTGRFLYNRATSPHQPGSSIKPLAIYSAALQSAYEAHRNGTTQHFATYDANGAEVPNLYGNYWTTASIIDDAPMSFEGRTWPSNFYSGYRGLYTFRTALQQSVNVCAVKIFQQLGSAYAASNLKRLGISTLVEEGETNDMNAAALALGGMTRGVTPLEMAAAYGTFPNEGVYTQPIAYTQVTNRNGELMIANEAKSSQALDPGVAYIMTDVLRSVVTEGIAGAAAVPGHSVGGKTGTTGTASDRFDIWFSGFSPRYSAALWIGNDVNIELSQSSTAAARLWSKVMSQVLAGQSAGSYPAAPGNVSTAVIDTKSGKLPSELSSLDPRGTLRTEYFISGTEPTEFDDVHSYVTICTETGFLATPWCTYLSSSFGVRRPYVPDPSVGDISYEVPHYFCYLHNHDTESYPVDPNGALAYTWDGIDQTQPLDEEDPHGDEGELPSWLDSSQNKPSGDTQDGSGGQKNSDGEAGSGSDQKNENERNNDGSDGDNNNDGNGGNESADERTRENESAGSDGGSADDELPAWL